ncbi:methyltransferase domain-containing protein [Tomitella fengzijianii]|uniref:Methyltransferase domain-containing protein n=1 Tax=Tomitella fengzijianii TaxID=2597660 RepID=A0A516X6Y7_9ACTN|nr:methyltransferase domain-containing protein [Tomitella fengzijianii]QDQ98421.1 methyltransferase domain-containing protein [Tomitella fengzijianii]
MARPTRWFSETSEGHSRWYIDRFRAMAAQGADLAGEARMIDAMVPRGARVLDAGCGPGRLGGELHARGHQVVGVDVDPALVAAAEQDHPGPTWLVGDLSELDLPARGVTGGFDAAVMAGNVICFVAPGSETDVLAAVGGHLKPEGVLVVGFGMGRTLTVEEFDEHVAAAGLRVRQRFGTWDLEPWTPDSDFVVSVLHRGEA